LAVDPDRVAELMQGRDTCALDGQSSVGNAGEADEFKALPPGFKRLGWRTQAAWKLRLQQDSGHVVAC
jgi:hypothetical protein